ncbi:MAG: PASTA domain-containing protein [Desulfobacterales bacterium]|nr:MAG: PASTA domain-containing protein [Desulfobacterales bacterium]
MIGRIVKIAALAVVFILAAGISAYLTLTLIIESEDTVIVPDLVGKDVVYTLEFLSDLELNTKVKGSEYSDNIPKNHVIFHDPSAGEEIKKGRDVRIIISKGPKSISMPNLLSLTVQQAGLIMEENGVCQGELSQIYSESMEKDHIIAQVPSPGSMITRGTCVDFLISQGSRPEAYKMPNLSGQTLNEVILVLEKSYLNIGEIKSSFDKSRLRNVILNQEPLPGYRVVAGTPVNLVINRKSLKEGSSVVQAQKSGSLFRYRAQNGFLRRRIRVKLNSAGITNDLFDEFVKPGDEIWLFIPHDNDTTVFLYEDDNLVKTETYDAW